MVVSPFDFSQFGVEPVPIGPTLNGAGLGGYDKRPYPTSGVFLMLLAAALGKGADVAGIDLYRHPSGQTYVGSQCDTARFAWPPHHSLQCDLHHIRQALASSVRRFNLSPDLQNATDQTSSSNEGHQ